MAFEINAAMRILAVRGDAEKPKSKRPLPEAPPMPFDRNAPEEPVTVQHDNKAPGFSIPKPPAGQTPHPKAEPKKEPVKPSAPPKPAAAPKEPPKRKPKEGDTRPGKDTNNQLYNGGRWMDHDGGKDNGPSGWHGRPGEYSHISEHKEGDTKPAADGGTLVLMNGRWHRKEKLKGQPGAKPAPQSGAKPKAQPSAEDVEDDVLEDAEEEEDDPLFNVPRGNPGDLMTPGDWSELINDDDDPKKKGKKSKAPAKKPVKPQW